MYFNQNGYFLLKLGSPGKSTEFVACISMYIIMYVLYIEKSYRVQNLVI